MFEYLAPSWRNFLEGLEGLGLLEKVCRWAEEAFEISRLTPFPMCLSLCLLFVIKMCSLGCSRHHAFTLPLWTLAL